MFHSQSLLFACVIFIEFRNSGHTFKTHQLPPIARYGSPFAKKEDFDHIHFSLFRSFSRPQNKTEQTNKMPQKFTVELVLDCHCDLGEGPTYDPRRHILYFVDINRNTIHAFHTQTKEHDTMVLDEPVGAIGLTTDPDLLLAATRRSILLVRFAPFSKGNANTTIESKKVLRTLAQTPEEHGTDDAMRFNDCKVSPQGALIAGRMHGAWRTPGHRGRLYCLTGRESHELKEILGPEEVGLPNGIAWNRTGDTMYFVDSAEESITAYTDNDPITGAPSTDESTRTVIYKKDTGHKHVPDGMCVDSDGALWVVFGESGAVSKLDPGNGEELLRVELPVKRPTSCGFGDDGWLYVTTRVEGGEGASAHHGGLFRIKAEGVKGMREVDSGYYPIF